MRTDRRQAGQVVLDLQDAVRAGDASRELGLPNAHELAGERDDIRREGLDVLHEGARDEGGVRQE